MATGTESSRPQPEDPRPGTLPRNDSCVEPPSPVIVRSAAAIRAAQPQRVGHHVDPRPDVGAQERHQAEPQPTRGAGAGFIAQIDADVARDDGGHVGERAIEHDHVVGRTPPSAARRPRSRRPDR